MRYTAFRPKTNVKKIHCWGACPSNDALVVFFENFWGGGTVEEFEQKYFGTFQKKGSVMAVKPEVQKHRITW